MFVSREHGARLRHQLPLIALVVFALALGLGAIVFHVYTLGLLVGVLTLGQLRRRATRQRQRL